MKLMMTSWKARALAAGLTLAAALVGSAAQAQTQNAPITPVALTDDIVVRVLGMEKDALTPPTGEDEAAKKDKERIGALRTKFGMAIAQFQAGDGAAAEKSLTEAKALDASLSSPSVYLARFCFAVNDQNLVRTGRAFLDKAVNDDPLAPEAYLMFGNLALLEGRLADANLHFEKAATLAEGKKGTWTPKQSDTFLKSVYGGKVSVNEQRNNWSQGLNEINAWLAIDPADPIAQYRKGRIVYMKAPNEASSLTEARTLFTEAYTAAVAALGANPKDELPGVPPSELALIELQTQLNKIEDAKKEIETLNKNVETYKGKKEISRINTTVSQWYLQQGEFAKAQEYAAKAATADPDSLAIQQLTALLEYYAGSMDLAEASFTKLNQQNPEDPFAANYLALTLIESPDEAKRLKAVKVAEVAAKLNQKSAVALATLGWCYKKTDRLGEAAQIFAALEQEKNLQISADMAYYMAITFGALPPEQFPTALGKARSLLGQIVNTKGAFKHRDLAQKQFQNWGGTMAATTPEAKNTTIVPATLPATTPKPAPSVPTPPPATSPTTPPSDGENK